MTIFAVEGKESQCILKKNNAAFLVEASIEDGIEVMEISRMSKQGNRRHQILPWLWCCPLVSQFQYMSWYQMHAVTH